jgi:hypothetical protein
LQNTWQGSVDIDAEYPTSNQLRHQTTHPNFSSTITVNDKNIVLITGGNTRIGHDTVKSLYASSEVYTILIGSQSLDKAKTAISTLKSSNTNSQSGLVPTQADIKDN